MVRVVAVGLSGEELFTFELQSSYWLPLFRRAATFKGCSVSEIQLAQGSTVLSPCGEATIDEAATVSVIQMPPMCFTCGAVTTRDTACSCCGTVLFCDESCRAEGAYLHRSNCNGCRLVTLFGHLKRARPLGPHLATKKIKMDT